MTKHASQFEIDRQAGQLFTPEMRRLGFEKPYSKAVLIDRLAELVEKVKSGEATVYTALIGRKSKTLAIRYLDTKFFSDDAKERQKKGRTLDGFEADGDDLIRHRTEYMQHDRESRAAMVDETAAKIMEGLAVIPGAHATHHDRDSMKKAARFVGVPKAVQYLDREEAEKVFDRAVKKLERESHIDRAPEGDQDRGQQIRYVVDVDFQVEGMFIYAEDQRAKADRAVAQAEKELEEIQARIDRLKAKSERFAAREAEVADKVHPDRVKKIRARMADTYWGRSDEWSL